MKLNGFLSRVAFFVMAYEIFKDGLQDKLKDFYSEGFDENGTIVSDKYKTRFCGRKPYESPFFESIKWFIEMEALNQEDFDLIKKLKKKRDDLSHRMMEVLFENQNLIDSSDIQTIVDLQFKLDNWWIVNFECAIDPDLYERHSSSELEKATSMTNVILKQLSALLIDTIEASE